MISMIIGLIVISITAENEYVQQPLLLMRHDKIPILHLSRSCSIASMDLPEV